MKDARHHHIQEVFRRTIDTGRDHVDANARLIDAHRHDESVRMYR